MNALALEVPKSRPLRILCLGAHSDDLEIGCGGTILGLNQSHPGMDLKWVVFGAGGIRSYEARQSAARFLAGLKSPTVDVYEFRDGFFPSDWPRIKEIFEGMKEWGSPDLIFTHTREDRHQDHRVISDLTWNTYRDHLILEYEIPKYDGDLGQPNTFVETPRSIVDKKIQFLMEGFASQRSKRWFTEETFRALLRMRGIEAGVEYAEAYYGRKTVAKLFDVPTK